MKEADNAKIAEFSWLFKSELKSLFYSFIGYGTSYCTLHEMFSPNVKITICIT